MESAIYEPFLHPNLDISDGMIENEKKPRRCKALFRRLDEGYLKPFLIFRYDTIREQRKEEFERLLNGEGEPSKA